MTDFSRGVKTSTAPPRMGMSHRAVHRLWRAWDGLDQVETGRGFVRILGEKKAWVRRLHKRRTSIVRQMAIVRA
jgi:hypothetical protein